MQKTINVLFAGPPRFGERPKTKMRTVVLQSVPRTGKALALAEQRATEAKRKSEARARKEKLDRLRNA